MSTQTEIVLKNIDGYEYSLDGKIWQDSNKFDNLEDNTEYIFYQRIAETDTMYASEISDGVTIKTEREIKETAVNVSYDKADEVCKVNYEITAADLSKAPILYTAFYDDKYALVSVSIKDKNFLSMEEFSIAVPNDGTKCKVMFWDKSFSPLCVAEVCEIE